MSLCIFIADADNPRLKRCSRPGCSNYVVTDHAPEQCFAECESPEAPKGPALHVRALNFAKAIFSQAPLVAEALITGDESRSIRSQAEIEQIAAICRGCPLFDGERCTHKNCGCPIDTERNAWWSKIAWRSQRCPDDPPRW